MRDFAFFMGGFLCCLAVIAAMLVIDMLAARRQWRRMGYADLIHLSSDEGRAAQARSDSSEHAGGSRQLPPSLRVIRGDE